MSEITNRAAEIHRGMTPHQMALRLVEQGDQLDRAVRALTRAGFTDLGGQEWKPPLGPSASPLLDRVDVLTVLLSEARKYVSPVSRPEREIRTVQAVVSMIDDALAGRLP